MIKVRMPPTDGTALHRKEFAVLTIRIAVCLLAAQAIYGQGVIQTIAGTDWIFPSNGRPAVNAALGRPRNAMFENQGLAVDSQGNLYIADPGNKMVFRVDRNGILTVVAGNGIRGFSGDGGPATSASFDDPSDVAVDARGNIYVVDRSGAIRRISPDGIIRSVAGLSGGSVAVDADGNLYVTGGNRVDRKSVV